MKKITSLLTGVMLVMGMATAAYAIPVGTPGGPSLQLDIVGGTYEGLPGSETIIASSNVFTLNALLLPDNQGVNTPSDEYFISAALIPDQGVSSGNYGSFTIDGTTVNVTADMVYGKPPVDALYPDLGPHGIFPTWYKEISFFFDATKQYTPYNSQEDPGTTPTENATGGMYVKSFAIDISGLSAGLGIHFDLYNENIKTNGNGNGNGNINYSIDFAPFSHDAEGSNTPVPEPGTMMLLGFGMFGLAILGKRRMNK